MVTEYLTWLEALRVAFWMNSISNRLPTCGLMANSAREDILCLLVLKHRQFTPVKVDIFQENDENVCTWVGGYAVLRCC